MRFNEHAPDSSPGRACRMDFGRHADLQCAESRPCSPTMASIQWRRPSRQSNHWYSKCVQRLLWHLVLLAHATPLKIKETQSQLKHAGKIHAWLHVVAAQTVNFHLLSVSTLLWFLDRFHPSTVTPMLRYRTCLGWLPFSRYHPIRATASQELLSVSVPDWPPRNPFSRGDSSMPTEYTNGHVSFVF